MQQQPADTALIQEVRRLLAERAAKKRELDAIDQALDLVVGMSPLEQRPKKSRLQPKDLRRMARTQ